MQHLIKNRGVRLAIACFFAISCLLPTQAVFALKDCGSHVVKVCSEHSEAHLVLSHDDSLHLETSLNESENVLKSLTNQESDHHLESTNQFIIIASSFVFNIDCLLFTIFDFNISVTEIAQLKNYIQANAPPEKITDIILSFLSSVRLQL